MMQDEIDKLRPSLGDELAPIYCYVKNDVFALRNQWKPYKSLFGTNEERFRLLQEISGTVSQTLERTLFEATLLGLRRITDKAASRGSNYAVTIKALPKHFSGMEAEHIRRLVSEAERAADFARNWADKKIAHSDYQFRIGALRLKPASRKKVDEAMW